MRSGPKATTRQYKEVRGLARGLDLLRALNRLPGGIGSTTELAKLCSLDRTTTKRLLETLRAQGLVRQGERDGQYYLTFEVRRLSEGFEDETWVAQVATPLMHASVRELVWPCDLGTAEAGFMVVRESTHRWSPLSQHRAMIGERMPLLVTALGRAYLSACEEVEREGLLELLKRRDDWIGEQARDASYVKRAIRETLRRGYAYNDGEWLREASYAAVAVPVLAGDRVLAALNLVFPKAAVSKKDLEGRFVPALKRLAATLGNASRALVEA
jgi:IclR family transcriptional regulator, mhp operon transcriptional activator